MIVKEAAIPKAKSEAVPEVKIEGQPKPPLTLTSQTRKLEFAPPSKPEKPPPQPQAEVPAQEDGEDTDLQAALHESLKAPSSPQPESGAQSSTPKPLVDLDKQETELIAQLDRLMEESVRLESLPNPTVRDRSRIRSIATVLDDVEMKIKETDAQKQAQSSKRLAKTQEVSAPEVAPDVTSQVSRVNTTPMEVRPVAPPSTQPLTLDNLMAGITQPARTPPTPAVSPEAQLLTVIGQDQPKAPPQSMPKEDRPQPPQPPSPVQPQPPVIPQEHLNLLHWQLRISQCKKERKWWKNLRRNERGLQLVSLLIQKETFSTPT